MKNMRGSASGYSGLGFFLVPFSVEPRPPLFLAWSLAWLCHLVSHLLMRFVSTSHYMSKILLCYFHCCRSLMNFFAGSTHFFTRKFFHIIHVYDNGIHIDTSVPQQTGSSKESGKRSKTVSGRDAPNDQQLLESETSLAFNGNEI